MLEITPDLAIPDDELDERFIQASGPGGQNVNKVATAVQLRFDAAGSRALPPEVRERLLRAAGSRLTADGALLITARRFRTQEANRRDARARLPRSSHGRCRSPASGALPARPVPPRSGGCRKNLGAPPSSAGAPSGRTTNEPGRAP